MIRALTENNTESVLNQAKPVQNDSTIAHPFPAPTAKWGMLLLTGLLLSACASTPHQTPEIEDVSIPPVERELPENPGPDDPPPPPETTAATGSLLLAAYDALDDNQPKTAVAYLERAIRINPRDPNLWIQLSAAHIADGNLTAANQHVRKAIALAGNDPLEQRDAWLQMAKVREAEGNQAEADAIRRRYNRARG